MDLKSLRLQMLRGSLIRGLLLRGSLLAFCMLVVSVIHMAHDAQYSESFMHNFDECTVKFGSNTSMNFSGLTKPMSDFSFSRFRSSAIPCEERPRNA